MYEVKKTHLIPFYQEIDHDYEKKSATGFGVLFGVLLHVR
jgi:hypothetical protein